MTDLDQSPRLQQFSRSAIGFVLGGVIGLVVLLLVWRSYFAEPAIPPLTSADWERAVQQWEAAGVRDYDVEIVVQGRQPATYAVQVRDGQAVQATRNGDPLPQRRTWTTWTVDGMFETISRDLDSVDRHATGRADASTPRLQLRAAFDPQYGLPQRYLRTEMVRFGANPEVSWLVVKFKRH